MKIWIIRWVYIIKSNFAYCYNTAEFLFSGTFALINLKDTFFKDKNRIFTFAGGTLCLPQTKTFAQILKRV